MNGDERRSPAPAAKAESYIARRGKHGPPILISGPKVADLSDERLEEMQEEFRRLLKASPTVYLTLGLRTKQRTAPGSQLRRLAERVASPSTYASVLEPTLSDLTEEHTLALAEERPWRARRVLFRGYCSFWAAVAAHLVAALGRRVAKLWARS